MSPKPAAWRIDTCAKRPPEVDCSLTRPGQRTIEPIGLAHESVRNQASALD